MNDNVRHLFGGATPEQVLEAARSFEPRVLALLVIDKDGQQHTLVSSANGADLAFLLVSFQAHLNKLFAGG